MLPKVKKILSRKIIVFLVILSAIIAYGIYNFMQSSESSQNAKVVEVQLAERKNIQQTAQFIGTIKSERATILTAKSGGILDRLIDAGQSVKKGALIASIENKELEKGYKLSREMEQIAKLQFDRYNQLYQTGVTSKSVMEEKKSAWIEYQKKLSDAKLATNENSIAAPFDGIVGIFKIHEGSQVQTGDAIVSFYDPSSMIVEFDVPLSIVSSIQDESIVYVNQKQYPLTYIQRMLDDDTHMSPAYARIECDQCIIGATTDITLVIKKANAVIVIPYEAVFLRNGKSFVYIVKDNKAMLTPVMLGIREKELVEITSGLQEKDAVIIHGQARLYPNATVKISTTKQ